MNEQQTMLDDMTSALFAELGQTTPLAESWPKIDELGLPNLLVGVEAGGFGGSWQEALIVFRNAGFHALSAPLVEAILAAHVGSSLGFAGRGTIANCTDASSSDGRFTGTLRGVVAADGANFVVVPLADRGSMVVALDNTTRHERFSLSGEAHDVVSLIDARAVRSPVDMMALAAFARSAQIAGALDASLALSAGYVNERKQFGRMLAKFQAVQQNLATFACEAAAANCATMAAAQALDRGDAGFEVAAAKLRCNRAVGVGTAIAHQAHGAIGFTAEYSLHPFTRRLWAWRSEFGNDSHWADWLGGDVCARGADGFWSHLTHLTDRMIA